MLDRLLGAAMSSPSAVTIIVTVIEPAGVGSQLCMKNTMISSGVTCSTVLLHAACLLCITLPAL